MKKIQIVDNFLDKESFSFIEENMMSINFPWHWNSTVLGPYDDDENILLCDKLYDFQFTHSFYHSDQPQSDLFSLVIPILNKINPRSLIRSKANLLPKTEQIIKHGYHIDYEFECITSIFYLNTCDGYTEFEDGTKVDSVSNRLVTFNSLLNHTGTTCTDKKCRVVINFNYF